jgi:hypothetical protein
MSTAMRVSVQITQACEGPTVIQKLHPRSLEPGWRKPGCCPAGVDYYYQVGAEGPVRAVTWDPAGRPIYSRPAGADPKLPLDVVTLTVYF